MNELLLFLVIFRYEIYDNVNNEKGVCNYFVYSVIKFLYLIWKNELNIKDFLNM